MSSSVPFEDYSQLSQRTNILFTSRYKLVRIFNVKCIKSVRLSCPFWRSGDYQPVPIQQSNTFPLPIDQWDTLRIVKSASQSLLSNFNSAGNYFKISKWTVIVILAFNSASLDCIRIGLHFFKTCESCFYLRRSTYFFSNILILTWELSVYNFLNLGDYSYNTGLDLKLKNNYPSIETTCIRGKIVIPFSSPFRA